jgi:uncharacterized membrane protein YagU involved in acid resistance
MPRRNRVRQSRLSNRLKPPRRQLKVGLFNSPNEALKDVQGYFQGWTKALTQTSFQLSFAVIAANWAAFGSVSEIMRNPFSKLSVALIVLGMGVNLLASWHLCNSLESRIHEAEACPEKWYFEFEKAVGKSNDFPHSPKTVLLARRLRIIKAWFPVIAGILFIAAIYFPLNHERTRTPNLPTWHVVPLEVISGLTPTG